MPRWYAGNDRPRPDLRNQQSARDRFVAMIEVEKGAQSGDHAVIRSGKDMDVGTADRRCRDFQQRVERPDLVNGF